MIRRLPRTTPLAAALFAGLFAATAASAAPTIGATSSANVPGAVTTTTPFSVPGYVNSNSAANGAAGNANGFSFASSGGAFAVSTNAEGKGDASAAAVFSQTVENNSGIAQHYFLTMKIYGGSIGLQVSDPAGLAADEFLRAFYDASVKVDGISKFHSYTKVEKDGITNVGQCTHSGVVLTGASSCGAGDGVYFWNTDYYTIDLGVLAAGDDMLVSADLTGGAVAMVGTYDFGSIGNEYGNYGCFANTNNTSQAVSVVASECTAFKGRAYEFYGDPQGLRGDPQNVDPDAQFVIRQGTVPAPVTPALLGLGLGALAWTGRRRKKKAEQADAGAPPPA